GEIGRNLDADVTVGAMRRIERRTQNVRRPLDVFDREMFENFTDRLISRLQQARDGGVVFLGMADGLLEDRGVRCHPAQAVVIDELLQSALGNESARKKIEPNGLTMIRKRA